MIVRRRWAFETVRIFETENRVEIQSDLIILPPTNFLPLHWSVRGPLGLETGAEVSIGLVTNSSAKPGLPDIIVTPLQTEFLEHTYRLELELGERAGAVADFLTWLGESIEKKTGNNVNIVLSETITVEGRKKHKMHIVLEPASESKLVQRTEIESIMTELKESHEDVIDFGVSQIYKSSDLNFILQQDARVENGWIKYGAWKEKILEEFPNAERDYDLGKVVVSSNPDQRLLRFIIPKKGVIELRVPHKNRPGALREISNVIRSEQYNILSSRLSRTPPLNRTGKTSVFVAACEPFKVVSDDISPFAPIRMMLGSGDHGASNIEALRKRLLAIDNKYNINSVSVSQGRRAENTLFLVPRLREMVSIDEDIANFRADIRDDIVRKYFSEHKKHPIKYIFLSVRFIDPTEHKSIYDEQQKSIGKMIRGIEEAGCAVIQAVNPGNDEGRYYDLQVYKAVFSRLWASDACAVLALNEEGAGGLSNSISHEIGFFAGRNRPLKVFVSNKRDKDPVFGNIVGMNRIKYSDAPAAFDDSEPESLFQKVNGWVKSICMET